MDRGLVQEEMSNIYRKNKIEIEVNRHGVNVMDYISVNSYCRCTFDRIVRPIWLALHC